MNINKNKVLTVTFLCTVMILIGFLYFIFSTFYKEKATLIKNINVTTNYAVQALSKFTSNWDTLKKFKIVNLDSVNYFSNDSYKKHNIIANGNFEDNTSFVETDYDKINVVGNFHPSINGSYSVFKSTYFYYKNWQGKAIDDNYFMLCDGSAKPNSVVWQQTVSVNKNTSYNFSFYVSSLSIDTLQNGNSNWMKAHLQVFINNELVCADITPDSLNTWKKISGNWNSLNNSIATIEIKNANTIGIFNDFGIDAISLKPCSKKAFISNQLHGDKFLYDNINDSIYLSSIFSILLKAELQYSQLTNIGYSFVMSNFLRGIEFSKVASNNSLNNTISISPELSKKYFERFEESLNRKNLNTKPYSFYKNFLISVSITNYKFFLWRRLSFLLFCFFLVLIFSIIILYLLHKWLYEIKSSFDERANTLKLIAHELKTPVTAISLALEALEKYQNIPQLKEKASYFLAQSRRQASRLNTLIIDVLQAMKTKESLTYLNIEKFDLVDTIKTTIELQKLKHSKSFGTTITLNNSDTFIIYADKISIENVISNLLDNAIKYSHQNIHITISLNNILNHCQINISDNGIGIEKKYYNKIFEPFFRIDSSDTKTENGFGLGLAYCKKVMDLHNGIIMVKQNLPQGTTFILEIPIQYE